MTTQEKLIEYAKKHNNGKVLTNEEFIGKMITEGCVIARTPNSMTVANAKRDGKTIIVTETIKTDVTNIVDGKLVIVKHGNIETAEVLRIEL